MRENKYIPALEKRAWARKTERITKVLIVWFKREKKRVVRMSEGLKSVGEPGKCLDRTP